MTAMKPKLQDFFADEGAATAVEYALFAASIAGVIVAIVFALGGSVNTLFTNANATFEKSLPQSSGD